MKIAFISYEYPPDTAYGGIATYVHQAAKMLSRRGHHVEVFTASPDRSGTEAEDGLLVHRISEKRQHKFSGPIGQVFADRHATVEFDVLEGPEYSADAREAVRLVPDIPLVIKLHTPSLFLFRLNYYESSFLTKAQMYIYTLKADKVERSHALEADEIAAPSKEIGDKLVAEWGLDPAKISHVPYPFTPSKELLKIPVETKTNFITFVGRLEFRKGVVDLARAIPLILHRYPHTKFRFVGSSESSPNPKIDMRRYLENLVQPYSGSVEFTGYLPYESIAQVFENTDICIFPSVWENFPCVCLEAMAAARGIVGSKAGGIAEMLNNGDVGRLIPERSPNKIAEAVAELLEDCGLRMRLGAAARERVLTEYNADRVGALQEASYARAILRRRALGPRSRITS